MWTEVFIVTGSGGRQEALQIKEAIDSKKLGHLSLLPDKLCDGTVVFAGNARSARIGDFVVEFSTTCRYLASAIFDLLEQRITGTSGALAGATRARRRHVIHSLAVRSERLM
jgi:hypothetical protein